MRWVLAALALAVLPACGTLYLTQAARGQWQLMHARQPIDRVIADERTAADLRANLSQVRLARDFASQALGLPDNASYRTYADVQRPYVVWNVVATPAFSVEPLRWCFPIAGCVAYRGYFSERQARSFALTLRSRGYDAVVEGVPAYSTLGRFADPVLNTMFGYGDVELAAMIFHELAHQLIYVPGDSDFNEAFAVTVEQTGLVRWLTQLGREKELQRYLAQQAHRDEYLALFMRRRAELARLYASILPPAAMRERKQTVLFALGTDLRTLAERQGSSLPYEDWVNAGLNNAYLASVATYSRCVPGFERLLAEQRGDLTSFYLSVRRLAALPPSERHDPLCHDKP